MLLSTVAHAGVGVWTSGGPYGGFVTPWPWIPRPRTLYAGTFYGGVLKSTDSGGTWAAANTGLTNLFVYALVINPTTPATLYAGTATGCSSPPTPATPGLPATRDCRTRRLRPGHQSLDPRHALRRDGARGLQVHRFRRHLGRRQLRTDPRVSTLWPSIPRPPPRSTPGRTARSLQVHRLRRHLGCRQTD